MRKGTWRALWIAPAVLMMLALHAPAQAADAGRVTRFELPGSQSRPRTDGATIVWIDGRAGDPRNSDIYGATFADGRVFPIATGPADQSMPDVDGNFVVWQETASACPPACDRNIRALNLASGESFDVAATGADEAYPAVAGGYAVWIEADPARQGLAIKLRDLQAMSEAIMIAEAPPETGVVMPLIQSDRNGVRVVWLETGGGRAQLWRLRLHDRPIASPTATIDLATGAGPTFGHDVRGDRVALATLDGLLVYSLEAYPPPRAQLRQAPYLMEPALAEDHIFWVESDQSYNFRLRGLDVWSPAFDVATDGSNVSPHTRGGLLVWSHDTGGDSDIFAIRVADALPTGWRSPPATPRPDLRYFPETGHNLAFGFKAFWERSGGLPVFGYPLSEEFDEFNVDLQRPLTAQFFERQRFEYHPERAGTPYEVQLGRLGAWLLERQGRRWEDQPKASPSDPHYFAETGQAITHAPFWQYWRSHGLEFGDPGVSFREALALWGYPLTPAQIERNPDGDLVLTQWFERARFEWHPDNPDPHRVLLGRLGAELLAQRGWVAP